MPEGKGKKKTGGRKKGTPNKVTADLKKAILSAFVDGDEELGVPNGRDWLMIQKRDNPAIFKDMVNRVLPTQIEAEVQTTTKEVVINMIGLDPIKEIPSEVPSEAPVLIEQEAAS